MQNYVIAPSMLSANWACFGDEAKKVLQAGADWLHIDVMDNHFVPNLTFGPTLCQALRDHGIEAHLDVHLMVEPVDDLIQAFAKAGANSISFHPEATKHVDRSLNLIQDLGCMAGVAINPSTSLTHLEYLLEKLDLILLMTVNPGFSGQKFMPHLIEKIEQTSAMLRPLSRPVRLMVDGGITLNNLKAIAQAGADSFVSGSSIFGAKNYDLVIKNMRAILSN